MSKIDSILTRVNGLGGELGVEQVTPVALPVGTVTLLMADAEGSTRLWESKPDAMAPATVDHDRIVNESIGRHGGVKPKDQGEGDSFMAAFSRPSDAVEAAVEIQSLLAKAASLLKLRMAIHTGELQLRDESNYIGVTIGRTARLRSVAHGGQILLSQVTHDLLEDRQFKQISFKDLGVHRLKDLSRPERVFQLIHPDLTHDFSPLRSLDVLPNNLPAQRTTFIGRDKELQELRRLLENTRLLTLSGSGGAGKTRLGLQLGADLLESVEDGVWFVPLATLSEDGKVAGQIAAVLGVGESEAEILPNFVGVKSMILILDNAEQVVGGVSKVVSELLDACPNLRIIVTSREPLAVDGETTYRVPSLSLPADASRLPIDALTEYDSIQLFIDRAVRARPNFQLDDQNASIVTEICLRLDGIPLALELAAARVRVLSVTQILEGLSDRFRLLTGSSRTAVPRHQTLRASVEWSHDLLDETEKRAFRRLAVFPAAFDLDAAESVISSDDLPALQVLDLLTQLVDKSLLVAHEELAWTNYSLLETVRQYAQERLAESGEVDHFRRKHAMYYADVIDRLWATMLALEIDIGEMFSQMGPLANYETALETSLKMRDEDLVARLFGDALWVAYFEGRGWIETYLDRVLDLLETGTFNRARVLSNLSGLAGSRWEFAPYVDEALDILQVLPETQALRYLPTASWGRAILAMYKDRPKARARFQELKEVSERAGHLYWALWAEAMSGYTQSLDGEVEEGLSLMKQVIEKARAFEAPTLLGYLAFETGLGHRLAGKSEEGVPFYEEAVPLLRPASFKGRNSVFQWALDHLSHIYIELGRSEKAKPLIEEALDYSRDYKLESGNYWNILRNWGGIQFEEGNIAEALEIMKRAWEGTEEEFFKVKGIQGSGFIALSDLAALELRAGDREGGAEHLRLALRQSLEYQPTMGLTGKAPFRQVQEPLWVFVKAYAEEAPAQSARLYGFIEAWRKHHNVPRLSPYRALKEKELVDTFSKHLGEDRANRELDSGRRLSMEAAVAYALGEESDPLAAALLLSDQVEGSIRAGLPSGTSSDDSSAPLSKAGFSVPEAILKLAQGIRAKSEAHLHAALATLVDIQDAILVAACLEALAEIAAEQDSFEESARLCGAALSLREEAGQASMTCSMNLAHDALGHDLFERIVREGMRLSMEEAAEYATRGRGQRKRPSSGWKSLTPTESRVAELVADGLTNPQIAEQLFVSRRTIQTHLYNIFTKVGVSTRTELAAEMVRRTTTARTKGDT